MIYLMWALAQVGDHEAMEALDAQFPDNKVFSVGIQLIRGQRTGDSALFEAALDFVRARQLEAGNYDGLYLVGTTHDAVPDLEFLAEDVCDRRALRWSAWTRSHRASRLPTWRSWHPSPCRGETRWTRKVSRKGFGPGRCPSCQCCGSGKPLSSLRLGGQIRTGRTNTSFVRTCWDSWHPQRETSTRRHPTPTKSNPWIKLAIRPCRTTSRRACEPTFCSGRAGYTRALALQQLGMHEEALRWYEYGRHGIGSYFNVTLLAPSHYHRGEIFEELGDIEQAIWHYEAFAELWKDADPELMVKVREVLQHVAELRGETVDVTAN